MRTVHLCLGLALVTTAVRAQDIIGTVQVTRKLTKRSVTAPVPLYQRGATVKLATSSEDPLVFERTRVVVYLEGTIPSDDADTHRYVMQQLDRQFVPDLLVVPAGATVTLPNNDPIFHNVFSLSAAKSFDLGSYDKGDSRRITFGKPGIVSLYCHLHPNMAGTVLVAPNRFYARPDRDGHYVIHGVPPGHYTLVAWHRATGTLRQPIVVQASQNIVANFNVPMDESSATGAPRTRPQSVTLSARMP